MRDTSANNSCLNLISIDCFYLGISMLHLFSIFRTLQEVLALIEVKFKDGRQ